MMDPITYSLRLASPSSDTYYHQVSDFADQWLERAWVRVGECVGGFQAYQRSMGLPDRSFAECAFEMLVLGVLLREHSDEANRLPDWKGRLLAGLARWQGRLGRAEGAIKHMRGWLGWIDVIGEGASEGDYHISRLIHWLRAQDRSVQANRLAEWQSYFESIQPRLAQELVLQCLELADCFAEESVSVLGPYTEGVERFLTEVAPTHRGYYDLELVSRPRLEYHLGMLGTELLNRAYRARFVDTGHKIVIVPPCMRAQPEEKCKALQTPFGARCQACTPACRVHQITQLGKKDGFDVFIMPDELSRLGKGGGREGQIGVVGVACVLTNWNGGWQTADMGIPAQGILLDYVGCSYHWHDRGIPTDTNLNYLRRMMAGNHEPSGDCLSGADRPEDRPPRAQKR